MNIVIITKCTNSTLRTLTLTSIFILLFYFFVVCETKMKIINLQ